jgi:hypothetical protein
MHWRTRWDALRQRLVLTPEEKRVIAFVLIAFVLGVGTKYYRDAHPQPPSYIDKRHLRSRAQHVTPSPSYSPESTLRKSRKADPIATPLPRD